MKKVLEVVGFHRVTRDAHTPYGCYLTSPECGQTLTQRGCPPTGVRAAYWLTALSAPIADIKPG